MWSPPSARASRASRLATRSSDPQPRAHGGFAEHTVVRTEAGVAKPEEISFADAATIPVAGPPPTTAGTRSSSEAGQTLLILGIGGVGLMAAQIGKVHKVHRHRPR